MVMEENLEMKSYLKISEIISFIKKEFKNSEYTNLLETLNQNQERVFLGIIEIIDIEQEVDVFLDDVSIHLSHIFTKEKTKSLLEELDKIGVISMSSSLSFQIFPDWEQSSWNDYLPSNLSLNLTSSEDKLKQTISKNRFKNIYGYFKKDELSFLKIITELIRKNYIENTNVIIVKDTDLTFIRDTSGKSIRVNKKDKSPFLFNYIYLTTCFCCCLHLHRASMAIRLINFCIILIRRSHDSYFINDIITTCHFTYRVHGKLWCTNINSWQTCCRRYDGTNSRSTSHVLSHNKLLHR